MKNGLVEMTDGEETIAVAPAGVAQHQKLGWKLVHPEDLVEIAKGGFVPPANPRPEKLIQIYKDGQAIKVHPGTLENHLKLGWVIVDPDYLNAAVETAEKVIKAETATPRRKISRPSAKAKDE